MNSYDFRYFNTQQFFAVCSLRIERTTAFTFDYYNMKANFNVNFNVTIETIIVACVQVASRDQLKYRNLSKFKIRFHRTESFPQKILRLSKRTTLWL